MEQSRPHLDKMSRARQIDLLLLTCAAGALDALCYMRAHVFAANMTGNVVRLGIDLIRKSDDRGAWSAIAIACFAAGVLGAGLLLVRSPAGKTPEREIRSGMALELPLMLSFGLLLLWPGAQRWLRASLVLTGAAAMGVQSVAVRRLKIAGVVTTFITGTITTAIIEALSGQETGSADRGAPLLLLAMLLAYLGSAAAAAAWSWTNVPQFAALACVAAVRVRWPSGPRGPQP